MNSRNILTGIIIGLALAGLIALIVLKIEVLPFSGSFVAGIATLIGAWKSKIFTLRKRSYSLLSGHGGSAQPGSSSTNFMDQTSAFPNNLNTTVVDPPFQEPSLADIQDLVNSNINIDSIIRVIRKKDYLLNESDLRPSNINIIGIRNDNAIPNSFDDWVCLLWKEQGTWNLRQYKATTDPGSYWLLNYNAEEISGTAILKEGQYIDSYEVGYHRGKYLALKQVMPVTVIRDSNRDTTLDFQGAEYTGLFGINIHRAHGKHESIQVDNWSAGCQVIANPDDYDDFMRHCEDYRNNWKSRFTYTLINKKDFYV